MSTAVRAESWDGFAPSQNREWAFVGLKAEPMRKHWLKACQNIYRKLAERKGAYFGVIVNPIRRPLAEAMHFLVMRDFRHRHIASVAIGLHANTRSCPLKNSLQALVEPSVAGSVICVSDRSQVVVSHSDGIQIVTRELTQYLTVSDPDDFEIAGGVERELHGALLGCGEDGGSVGLLELLR